MVFERRTIVSEKVMEILTQANHALSAVQILDKLSEAGLSPNKTTIYRILEKLVEKKVASSVTFDNGVTYFELAKTHHHHFFCKNCETIFCLPACHIHTHQIPLTTMVPSENFTIEHHDFSLYGQCPDCSKKN